MNTIALILSIGKILLEAAPPLFKLWCALLAVIKPTPEVGNATTAEVVKSTARAILPVLDTETAAKVQAALDEHEASGNISQTYEQYLAWGAENQSAGMSP